MKYKKQSSGITLMETILAIGIFVFVSIILWSFIINSYKTQNFSMEQSDAINEARRGLETLVKELRESLPGDNGAYPIEIADAQNIIFYSDFDSDNAIEKVHYWLDGSELKKGVIEASGSPLAYNEIDEEITIISRYVRNNSMPIFTYHTENYSILNIPANVAEVKLVNIYLITNVMPERAPINYELESDVTLRNLKK